MAIVLVMFATSPASAEMLLAEFTYTAPQPVVAPASFGFGVGNVFIGADNFHNWIETVTTFPYTSTANPATVAAFDRLLTTAPHQDGVAFGLTNGPYAPPRTGPFDSFSVDRAFEGFYADRGLTATRYAPHIDIVAPYALYWYALTRIDRNVTATVQTIRIYGNAAPEPPTWLIMVFGVLPFLSRCCSCSTHGHRRRRYRRP